MEQKLQLASSAEFLAHHSAFAKAEKARKCCLELEDAEEQFGVALVEAQRDPEGAMVAKNEASKSEGNFVAEVGLRRD